MVVTCCRCSTEPPVGLLTLNDPFGGPGILERLTPSPIDPFRGLLEGLLERRSSTDCSMTDRMGDQAGRRLAIAYGVASGNPDSGFCSAATLPIASNLDPNEPYNE